MSHVAEKRSSDPIGTAHHDHLVRTLTSLDPEPSESQSEANLAVIRDIADSSTITEILQEYRGNPDLLAWAAGHSYRHANNFDKIVLFDSGDPRGYRLTMHLWEPPYTLAEQEEELIHDHRFSFWSGILAGTLVTENFEEAPSAVGAEESSPPYRKYRYVPDKVGTVTNANSYEYRGMRQLTMTGTVIAPKGHVYHLNYRQTHRVILPAESMVCTLVLRGPRERGYSNFYRNAYPRNDFEEANVMFAVDALAGKLERIIADVNGLVI